MAKFGSFKSPHPGYLDGCDELLNDQFDRGNEIGQQFGSRTIDPATEHWRHWRHYSTEHGHDIYVHGLAHLPAQRLLPLLSSGGTRAWSLLGFTKDGRIIMVMRGPAQLPLVYALSAHTTEQDLWKLAGLTTDIVIAWVYFIIFVVVFIYHSG